MEVDWVREVSTDGRLEKYKISVVCHHLHFGDYHCVVTEMCGEAHIVWYFKGEIEKSQATAPLEVGNLLRFFRALEEKILELNLPISFEAYGDDGYWEARFNLYSTIVKRLRARGFRKEVEMI